MKIDNAAEAVPAPEIRSRPDARHGLITLGACDGAVREAIECLEAEEGLRLDYMRIRGFPFTPEVGRFIEAHDLNIVIEQNRDAQLKALLTLETPASKERLTSFLRYGGLPLSAGHVVEGVKERLGLAADAAEGVGA